MKTNNNNQNNIPNAAFAELTGKNNKLTTQQIQSQQKHQGVWKKQLDWNVKLLQQTSFRNKALSKLLDATQHSKQLLQAPLCSLQTAGMLYAIVHLPTNMIYVIGSLKRLDISLKQQWYGAYLRNTKFHRTIQKGSMRQLLAWPLEMISTPATIANRKQFWIDKLLKKSIFSIKQTCLQVQDSLAGKDNKMPTIEPSSKKLAQQKFKWRPVSKIIRIQAEDQLALNETNSKHMNGDTETQLEEVFESQTSQTNVTLDQAAKVASEDAYLDRLTNETPTPCDEPPPIQNVSPTIKKWSFSFHKLQAQPEKNSIEKQHKTKHQSVQKPTYNQANSLKTNTSQEHIGQLVSTTMNSIVQTKTHSDEPLQIKNDNPTFNAETVPILPQSEQSQGIPEEPVLLQKYIDELIQQENRIYFPLLELKHKLKEQGVKTPEENEQVKNLTEACNKITNQKLQALAILHNLTRNVVQDREKTSNRRLKRLASRRKYGTTDDEI